MANDNDTDAILEEKSNQQDLDLQDIRREDND